MLEASAPARTVSSVLVPGGGRGTNLLPIHEIDSENLEGAVNRLSREDKINAVADVIACMQKAPQEAPNYSSLQSKGIMALFLLCQNSSESRKHIVDNGGLDVIKSVMKGGFADSGQVSESKILAQACATLYSISIEPGIRNKMTEQGAVEMLFSAINDHKENTQVGTLALMALNLLTWKSSESSGTAIRKLKDLEFLNIIFDIQDQYSGKQLPEVLNTLITTLLG